MSGKVIHVSKISLETYNKLADKGYAIVFKIVTPKPESLKEIRLRLKPFANKKD